MGLFAPVVYTFKDFMDQSLVMKACIGWGWLSVVIMILSFGEGAIAYLAA